MNHLADMVITVLFKSLVRVGVIVAIIFMSVGFAIGYLTQK